MRALAIATLVAATLPLPATAAPKKKEPSFEMIILAGGSTPAEAEAALTTTEGLFRRVVRAAAGYPKIVKSDDYEGLKPGFVILVAGLCAKKADAAAVRDVFNATGLVGVYTRTIKGAHEGQCPALNTTKSSSRGWDETEREQVVDGVASVVYRVLTRDVREPKGCTAKSVKIVVEQAGQELASQTFEGSCVAPLFEGDVGSSSSFTAGVHVDEGRRVVVVRREDWSFDTPSNVHEFYEWFNGYIANIPVDDEVENDVANE